MTMVANGANLSFEDAEPPTEVFDKVPVTDDVDAPCQTCGREAGLTPTGRKRKVCDDCKPQRKTSIRQTGKSAELAASAAKTLSNINGMFGLALAALGLMETAKKIFDLNDGFESAAADALVTDPAFCRQILAVGQASAKAGLGMAYISMGMGVAPVAAMEIRDKKLRKQAEMAD